jgi:hypothetical protein
MRKFTGRIAVVLVGLIVISTFKMKAFPDDGRTLKIAMLEAAQRKLAIELASQREEIELLRKAITSNEVQRIEVKSLAAARKAYPEDQKMTDMEQGLRIAKRELEAARAEVVVYRSFLFKDTQELIRK